MSNNLLVNTHYKLPWIIWKAEYSFSVPSGDWKRVEFAHNLPFIPLLLGQWSMNPDFAPSYDLGVDTPGGATGGQVPYSCLVSANSTHITAVADNNGSSSAQNFYLRLMAFAPPDYTGEVNPADYTSKFRYNSKYRYQKIYMAGRANANQILTHNLGYIPQAKLWSITNNTVRPAYGIITDTTLKTDSDQPYYYHIYKDALL